MEVRHVFNPDEALDLIENERPALAAIILDIMMPFGKRYDARQTLQGLRTGTVLYSDIRRFYPTTPVLALTNVVNGDVLEDLESDPLVTVVQKLDYTPNELGELIESLIAESQKGEEARDIH
jgi:CheY-like chemotaxis protein